tara:strand:+ start:18672 stop:18998 length:327 start_codon:yes stop_codon:yes gene_type:complete
MAKSTETSFWLSRRGLAAISLIGFASYFLLMEHSQHLFEYLPFLILLLCPLMHLFMHGGHGHKQGATDNAKPQSTQSDSEVPYSEGYEQGRKDALGDDSEGGRSHGQR